MRIWKGVRGVNKTPEKIALCLPKAPTKRMPTVHTCTVCGYESTRQFNVERHERRIHREQKLRTCCETTFWTKGDYYLHCEQVHPQTRSNAIMSKSKYKITGDMVDFNEDESHESCSSESTEVYNIRYNQRYVKRLHRSRRKIESDVSVNCSLIHDDTDIENVPLISFLTDQRLKRYLKTPSSSELNNRQADSESRNETNQALKIGISSKQQNSEKAVSENYVENSESEVPSSSALSVELPTKKLILHRFRMNVTREFEIPLQEQNNNVSSRVNFEGRQTKETPTLHWSQSKNSQCSSNKENVLNFTFSLEHQLSIHLDKEIARPVVSQQHRDFLSPIDFDKYKIF